MLEKYDITLREGIKGARVRVERKKQAKSLTWWYLGMVGQIGYTIAIPLAGGAVLGSVIDRALGTNPRGTLIGLGIGFVLSILGFVRVIRETLRKKVF